MAASVLPFLVLLFCAAGTFAKPKAVPVDVKKTAMNIVEDIRKFAADAKQGMTLTGISEGAREIETGAADFLAQLPKGADSCHANLVIKLAAARTGSHEILTLLQAEDQAAVLNGRLSLALAFLESVAQLMEDELALSTDVQGHLAAIVFGADMTDTIVENADELLNQTVSTSNDNSALKRRSWEASIKPTLKGGLGVKGSATWTSKSGRTSVNLSPSWSPNGGFGFGGGITFRW